MLQGRRLRGKGASGRLHRGCRSGTLARHKDAGGRGHGGPGSRALAAACSDLGVHVRINAVEALGLKAAAPVTVAALAAALGDEEDEVRFNAALALARLGPGAAAAVPALEGVLEDGNRYVVGYAVEALERIATREALGVLLPFLKAARWCPITNSGSLF